MKQTRPSDRHQSSVDPATINRWVEEARRGDHLAFHHLVDHFQPGIYRMIYYRTGSVADAEDLTQDVFLKAFKHLKRLQKTSAFRSWLYRIAVNRVRDYYRKKHFMSLFRMTSLDDEAHVETREMAADAPAPRDLARKEFWQQVSKAMRLLSHMEKEVFMLRFFDQLSIKEITDTMGKNESTVKTHLYRALRKLKHHFAGMEELLGDMV